MTTGRPDELLRPLRTDMKFDVERGTHVRVISKTEGVIEGLVMQNPTQIKTPTFLELFNAIRITGCPPTEEIESIGFVRLCSSDVQSVKLTEPKVKLKMSRRTEKTYRTLIISTVREFNRLAAMFGEVTEVALNFYGTYVGRDGQVGWITLFIHDDCLVCIDALELSVSIADFWTILSSTLFANEKIRKVVYNARPIVDYLYHKKCILMKNVDDLQVSELVASLMNDEVNQNVKAEYKLLSKMMEVFLKDIVPPEEIQVLKRFEEEDFSKESPLMERPPCCTGADMLYHYKAVAIEMKYLLQLRKILREEQLRKWTMCTKAQLEELVNADNYQMEMQMGYPLRVPENVLKCLKMSPKMGLLTLSSSSTGRNQMNGTNGSNS